MGVFFSFPFISPIFFDLRKTLKKPWVFQFFLGVVLSLAARMHALRRFSLERVLKISMDFFRLEKFFQVVARRETNRSGTRAKRLNDYGWRTAATPWHKSVHQTPPPTQLHPNNHPSAPPRLHPAIHIIESEYSLIIPDLIFSASSRKYILFFENLNINNHKFSMNIITSGTFSTSPGHLRASSN